MSELAETGSVADDRRGALTPYLDLLSASIGASAEGQAEPNLPPSLDLDRWEASALELGLQPGGHAAESWETLLAEGVALQAKFLAEIEKLGDDGALQPELRDRVKDQLIQTAAIGHALKVEIQRAVDAMILGGQMGQAKKLTLFRNKIGLLVTAADEQLGVEASALARTLGAGMVAPPRQQQAQRAEAKLEERAEAPPTQARFDKYDGRQPARFVKVKDVNSSHTMPLAIAFVVVVAAWAIFIAPRLWKTEVPPLTQADLAFSPAIQEVMARPPSLFLEVDSAAWESMASGERQDLVLLVGQTAEAAGYTGVNLRFADGRTVGQWSVRQGVKLIELTRSSS